MPNIIADIAGQYNTLIALTKQMPDEEFISLGDMVDRGPDSKKVIEFFRQEGCSAILGNHEHMMLDYCTDQSYYSEGIWFGNGGVATLRSFANKTDQHIYDIYPPVDVIKWLSSLPLYKEIDGYLISHSFIDADMDLKEACDLKDSIWTVGESRIIWNRRYPVRRPEYKLQIAGHNSQFGLKWFEDHQGKFALCLDDSSKKRLTGLHIPSMKIYQQDYIYFY